MKLRYFLPFLALSATLRTTAAEPPRLVVQIVVSSMRAEDLNRYADNFSDEGFLRLVRGGTFYPESHYDYLHTSTPVSLATLTTGANPSVHGIVAERWIDYVNNNVVELIKDRSAMGIDCDAGIGDCSPRNLVAPTLGESLQQSSPKSLVATVALDPASAVVAGGYTRNVFWMDAPRANWITSSFYAETLPVWARKYNLSREILGYIPFAWELKYPRERYRNSQSTVIDLNKPEHLRRKRHRLTSVEPEKPAPNVPSGIERMLYTPSGNAVTLAFAKQLLTQMRLGKDTAPDLLNICLDAPRRIAESYGPESIEVEDMYYRLDEELAQFLNYLYAQIAPEEVVVVLTSDHGTSPSYDARHRRTRPLQRRSVPGDRQQFPLRPARARGVGRRLRRQQSLPQPYAHLQQGARPGSHPERGGDLRHAVPRRVARAVVDGHAVELLRQRLRREDAEQLLSPPFGRRGGQPHARLHRGAAGRAVEIGIDVRLRHYRAARPLRRRHPRPQSGTQRRHDLRRPDAGLPARHSGAGRFGGHGFGRIQKIEDSTNG